MRKIITHISVLGVFVFFALTTHAQDELEIKVKKAGPVTREFVYHGQPVSPTALVEMFPSMEDDSSAETVDLRAHPFTGYTNKDTSWYPLAKDFQKERSFGSKLGPAYYRLQFDSVNNKISKIFAYVNYIFLGNTSGGKFIVFADYHGAGFTYLFILDIIGDKLVQLGRFEVVDISSNGLDIKGNYVFNGQRAYDIPMSAR